MTPVMLIAAVAASVAACGGSVDEPPTEEDGIEACDAACDNRPLQVSGEVCLERLREGAEVDQVTSFQQWRVRDDPLNCLFGCEDDRGDTTPACRGQFDALNRCVATADVYACTYGDTGTEPQVEGCVSEGQALDDCWKAERESE